VIWWFALISETDRGREDYPSFDAGTSKITIWKNWILIYITFTNYDSTFQGSSDSFFDKIILNNTLGEVLETSWEDADPIAETEEISTRNLLFSGGEKLI